MNLSRIRRQPALCILLFCGTGYAGTASLTPRGLPNFQKVNEHVYRGGQPTDEGFASLAALGVRTIIDLRSVGEHSQADEQKAVEGAGMRYVSIPMKGMSTPSAVSVSGALKLLESADAVPVFVHCQRGADRTGAVIACYRIQHDGWNSRKALDEAGNLGMSWYQRALKDYVVHFDSPRAPAISAPAIAATVITAGQ